jgi:DNA-binding IclR family transcriptional regulator
MPEISRSNEHAGKTYASRVASILICLGEGISTFTDIVNYSRLSKSTVHRILQSLVESQFVVMDPVYHRYYLGGLIHHITMKSESTHEYLIYRSIQEMVRLSDISDQTITLSILVGSLHYSLHSIASREELRITSEIKRHRIVYAGGRIRVLLSQLPDKELELILKNITLDRATSNTITDKSTFMEQIRQTREQGYAISYSERISGAGSISAPIRNYNCPVTISILGFENNIKPREDQLVKELLTSAERISESIKQIHYQER